MYIRHACAFITLFPPQGTTECHIVTTSEHQDAGNELRENGSCAPVEIVRVPVSATSLSYSEANDG